MNPADKVAELLAQLEGPELPADGALATVGELIDVSDDLHHAAGLRRAIQVCDLFLKRDLTGRQRSLFNYFVGNAWLASRSLGERTSWESPELESAILAFRRALSDDEVTESLPTERHCQILINLANSLSESGRRIEALELWQAALRVMPGNGMALGNQGIALARYADAISDTGVARLIRAFANDLLKRACEASLETPDVRPVFESWLSRTEGRTEVGPLDLTGMNTSSLGRSKREISYRRWCLAQHLFLNPINDLGEYSIGARDRMTLPSMIRPIDEGPIYQGLFNHLKQEFVSARYLYYEGTQVLNAHFSDRGVFLVNTLDYPAYSIHLEKVKMAFRAAYSILDKIAFFLNEYLGLCVDRSKVTFRTLWYVDGKRLRGLRPEISGLINWPFVGLLWIGKDLYEQRPEFQAAIYPDAQELAVIRNHAEHKYLKLHEGDWAGGGQSPFGDRMRDSLAFSVYRSDFEQKTLRLLKLVRGSLIHLSIGVFIEELHRQQDQPASALLPSYLPPLKDRWKV